MANTENKKEQLHSSEAASIPFGKSWLKKQVLLSILMVFGIVLAVLLNRCYTTMPWDEWTIFGTSAAYWRKPIAVAIFSSSIWGVSICTGCLFWWFVSWVTGANWSAGVRRIWENWSNSGLAPWLALISVSCILMTVLFPWAGGENPTRTDKAFVENSWFYNSSFFIVRQIAYAVILCSLALGARRASLKLDSITETKAVRSSYRNMRFFSAMALPVLAILAGFMSFDWLGGMSDSPSPSIMPLVFLSFAGVSGLAVSTATACLSSKYAGKENTGIKQGQLGALLLVSLMFKGYFAYSQLMLSWYGGIPEEQIFYGLPLETPYTPVWLLLSFGTIFSIILLLPPFVRKSSKLLLSVSLAVVLTSSMEICIITTSLTGIDPVSFMFIASWLTIMSVICMLMLAYVLSYMAHNRCFSVNHHLK